MVGIADLQMAFRSQCSAIRAADGPLRRSGSVSIAWTRPRWREGRIEPRHQQAARPSVADRGGANPPLDQASVARACHAIGDDTGDPRGSGEGRAAMRQPLRPTGVAPDASTTSRTGQPSKTGNPPPQAPERAAGAAHRNKPHRAFRDNQGPTSVAACAARSRDHFRPAWRTRRD